MQLHLQRIQAVERALKRSKSPWAKKYWKKVKDELQDTYK